MKDGKIVKVTGTAFKGIRLVSEYTHTQFYKPTIATPDHQHWVGDLNSVSQSTLSNQGYVTVLNRDMHTPKKEKRLMWKELQDMKQDVFLFPSNIEFDLQNDFEINLKNFSEKEKYLDKYIPEFETRVGGTTTIDVTRKGIDKAYGIRQIEKRLGISKNPFETNYRFTRLIWAGLFVISRRKIPEIAAARATNSTWVSAGRSNPYFAEAHVKSGVRIDDQNVLDTKIDLLFISPDRYVIFITALRRATQTERPVVSRHRRLEASRNRR